MRWKKTEQRLNLKQRFFHREPTECLDHTQYMTTGVKEKEPGVFVPTLFQLKGKK